MKRQLRQRDAENLVGLEILEAKDENGSLALTLSNGSILAIKSDYDIGLDYGRYPVAAVELNGQIIWTD
jgi:hypothetical protein